MEKKSYVKAEGEYEVRNITLYQLFDEARRDTSRPDTQLLCMDTGNKVSIADIWAKAEKYARGMLAMGMKKGDTLTVIACISEETASLYLAAVSIGVGYSHPYIYEPRNISIQEVIPLLEPKMLIVGEGMQGETLQALCEILNENQVKYPFIESIYYEATGDEGNLDNSWLKPLTDLIRAGETISDETLSNARNQVQPEDPAMHLLTSGSTGQPKAVVHSHYSIANELYVQCPKNIKPVLVNSVNLDELISYSGIWIALCRYTEMTVMAPSFDMSRAEEQLIQIVDTIIYEKVAHLAVSSGYILHLLDLVRESGYKFPDLKSVMLAGQIFSDQLRGDISSCLGAVPWNAYGMSETLNIGFSSKGFDEDSIRQRMSGHLVSKSNIELKLVDENGNVVDRGVEGEVLCKSYSFMSMYKNSCTEDTNDLFTKDGFIRSGDMAVMYDDGSFEIKGRKTDALRFKVFMETVYPAPIENAMKKHPAISEIAVISVAVNDTLGDEIIYCIRLNPGFEKPSEDELVVHLLQYLNEMKRPCRILYFDQLPRTNNGRKVNRRKLQSKVKDMLAEDPSLGSTQWLLESCPV